MAYNKIKPSVLTVTKRVSPGSSPSPAAEPRMPPASSDPAVPGGGRGPSHIQPCLGTGHALHTYSPCVRARRGRGCVGVQGSPRQNSNAWGPRVVRRSLPFPQTDYKVQPKTSELLLALQLENLPPPHNI